MKQVLLKNKIFQTSLLNAIQTLILYLVIIIPLEYLLTEHWLIWKRIGSDTKLTILLAVFVAIFCLNNFLEVTKKVMGISLKKILRIWSVGLVFFLLLNFIYSRYYDQLQTYPKIYNVDPNWSIQGSMVEIDGKNFGEPHIPGRVLVGEIEFQIKKWSKDRIIAEQPVPERFFTGNLIVVRDNGHESNPMEFTIKDPAELKQ